MAKLGYRTIDEMIGQADRLKMRKSIKHWKATSLDFSDLLHRPNVDHDAPHTGTQDHGLEKALDMRLLELAEPALERGERVRIDLPIENMNRTVGDDPRLRGQPEIRTRGTAGRHDRDRLHGFGGTEPRGLAPEGHHDQGRGRRERLSGKGLSGGAYRARAGRTPGSTRQEHHRRQRAALRRNRRRGLLPRRRRASASACGTRGRTRSSRASAITAAST